jgi:hypothetical protein
MFARGIVWQAPRIITVTYPADGAVFIADAPYEIVSITEIHDVAGTDAGAVNVDVVKSTGTQTTEAGTSLLGAVFNLKSAAATPVRKDRSSGGLAAKTICQLAKGDRLGVDLDGVLTSLAGFHLTLILLPIKTKGVY